MSWTGGNKNIITFFFYILLSTTGYKVLCKIKVQNTDGNNTQEKQSNKIENNTIYVKYQITNCNKNNQGIKWHKSNSVKVHFQMGLRQKTVWVCVRERDGEKISSLLTRQS